MRLARLLPLLAVLALPAQAATRYVGSCGAPSTTTIAAAVTAASAGDTLLICPGSYSETVTVNKDNLTLGASTGVAADVTVSNPGIPFTLSATGLTLRDMTVTSSNNIAISRPWTASPGTHAFANLVVSGKKQAIHVERSTAVSFTDLSATSRDETAIQLNSGADGAHRFSNVTARGKKYGIYAYIGAASFSNVTVAGKDDGALYFGGKYAATLANVTATSEDDLGIYLAWSGYRQDFSFTDVRVEAKKEGIHVEQSGKLTFTRVSVDSEDETALNVAWGADGEHVFDTVTARGKKYGLFVNQGAASFTDVTATAEDDDALYFGSKYPASLARITASARGGVGIRLVWGTSAQNAFSFSDVTVTAKDEGILVDQSGTLTMDDVSVDSEDDALLLNWGASGPHVLSNLSLNSDNGYGLYSASGLSSVTDFEITAKKQGIYVVSTYDTTLERGLVTSENEEGIVNASRYAKAFTVRDVTVTAKTTGILLNNTSSATIQEVCVNEARNGLTAAWGASRVNVTGSVFSDFDDYGVSISSSPPQAGSVSGSCFNKSSTPRAYSSSTAHTFNGNYWQGVAGGGSYSDGNVRDASTLASCPVIACYSGPAPVPAADYRFDECSYSGTSSEVRDSVGSYHGTAKNSLNTGDSGQNQRMANHDSNTRWVETSLPLGSAWTFSTWLKFPITTTHRYHVVGAVSGGGDLMYLDRSNSFRWGVYTLGGTRDGSFRFSTLSAGWHHVVLRGSGGTTQLYIDGSLTDSVSRQTTGTLKYLGTSYDDVNTSSAQGIGTPMDETRIYTRALEPEQIATLYTYQAAGLNGDGSSRTPVTCGGATPAAFNAVDVGANPVSGAITTKTAGSAFSLDVYALNAGRTAQDTAIDADVLLDLLANTSPGVALDAGNCPSSATSLSVGTVSLVDGKATASLGAVAEAWRDVRLRIRYPASGTATVTACSADNFAVKPASLVATASHADWQTAGSAASLNNGSASGGAIHKAGRPFTLGATAYNAAGVVTGQYDGNPTASVTCSLPASGCVAGTLSAGTFSAASGTVTSSTASYSEVGALSVTLTDSGFASVDSDDTAAGCAGFHLCASAITVGRFVPDHFDLAANTPAFAQGCGSFTYLGQPFGLATAPLWTVTARNLGGSTTANYTGSLMKISAASVTGQAWSDATQAVAAVGSLPDPTVTDLGAGQISVQFGVGDAAAGGGLGYARTALLAPFTASLGLAASVADSEGVAYAGNPYSQTGIAFSGGNSELRFGRLRLLNAAGSEYKALSVPLSAQYWNGQGFATNTADHCTVLAAPTLSFYAETADNKLASGETTASHNSPLVAGAGGLGLSAPGAGNHGFLDLGFSAPAWLDWNWDGTDQGGDGNLYDDDPQARAAFGKRQGRDRVIIRREIY